MNKELFVMENKTMCLFPWTHMYVHTTGDVFPCCIAEPLNKNLSLGNVKTQTIDEIWNGEPYKKLRKDMVEGRQDPHCNQCYIREYTEGRNYRHSSFDMFNKHLDDITENTQEDFSLKKTDIKYFDVRFSNLCSFKCRYCSEEFSTTWAAENRKRNTNNHLPAYMHVSDENPDFMEQLKKHMSGVEHMYFAGGEPLMTVEHYQILETLIDNNKTDVQLRYSSNCSVVSFKNYAATDLWKRFDKVDFRASLDSFGERAEYMRKGTDWNTIVSNILHIKKHTPNVDISINCVVSVYNILTITEFLQHLHDVGVLSWLDTRIVLYPITSDFFLDANVLPPSLKKVAKEKIEKFIQILPKHSKSSYELEIIKNYLNEDEVDIQHWKNFKVFNEDLDVFRGEKLTDVFPELANWYNHIL
jgi:radical SAM protein with 4Fe4S-binding SPASM domain